MRQPTDTSPFRVHRTHALSLIFGVLALLSMGGFTGCEMGGFSEDASTPEDTAAVVADSATLQISNFLGQDPGALTFYLYPYVASDYANAAGGRKIGTVEEDSTESFRVPAGKWKIACQNEARVLEPMEDEGSGGGEWLQSEFKKDQTYSLILTSNAGRKVWIPSYPTIPPITSP